MRFLFCLIAPLFIHQPTWAQNSQRDFDFEQKNGSRNIYPWVKSSYSQKKYLITLDSVIKHNGEYSLRISYDTTDKNNSDGVVFNNFPLDVIGRTLKFSAYVKQSNPNDTSVGISCIISQDKGEIKLVVKGFHVFNAGDWTLISREINLDTFNLPVHHIRLNILAKGKGSFWVDDIQLEVDGKNIYAIPSFSSSGNEKITPLTSQQVTNLKFLCYTWGFLKYFHPQVASGKYNWDMELFKIIPVVKKATSDKSLSKTLLEWINSLGDIPVCTKCYTIIPDSLFIKNLDQDWMMSSILSDELKNRLQYILTNRHTGDSYYAKYTNLKNLDFRSENEYLNWRDIEYPNEKFRLLLLFRYWNTIQYFYPYKYIIGNDWNRVLTSFLPLITKAADTVSYHLLMAEMINTVNDSHSGMPDLIVQKEIAPFTLPVKNIIIKNKAVVSEFKNDSLAILSGLQIGDVISKINGKTIKSIINEREKYINGSNYPVKLAYLNAYDYITGGKDSIVHLSIKRRNEDLSITTKRYRDIKIKNQKDSTLWRILPGNVGYVNMGLLEVKNVDSMFRYLLNTKAIVFDLRHYPRSTVQEICKYLYTQQTATARLLYPNLDYPGTFVWMKNNVYGVSAGHQRGFTHYKGKVVILVNENTQSQAEWTAMAFQAVPGALTIGSQTSGADGNVSAILLPGNYKTNMTGLGVFYPDGTATQRVGIRIDITVHPTVKGMLEKKDEVLEKALLVIQQ